VGREEGEGEGRDEDRAGGVEGVAEEEEGKDGEKGADDDGGDEEACSVSCRD
jgi:hypothetical protein